MTTGSRIKAAREKAKLTQEELGKKIGITGVAIMRYEKGQRNPKLETLQRIAAALNVPVSDLLEWEGISPGPWDISLKQKLAAVGCSVGFYEEDAILWINYPDGTLEVTEEDLRALNDSADSYLRFKLAELKETHKKDFKYNVPEKEEEKK